MTLATPTPTSASSQISPVTMIAASAAPMEEEEEVVPRSTKRTPRPTRSRGRSLGSLSTPPRPGEPPLRRPRPDPGTCSPGAARPALPTLVGCISSLGYAFFSNYYLPKFLQRPQAKACWVPTTTLWSSPLPPSSRTPSRGQPITGMHMIHLCQILYRVSHPLVPLDSVMFSYGSCELFLGSR